MAFLHLPPRWQLKESKATPQGVYLRRRELIKAMGIAGAGLLSGCYLSVDGDTREGLGAGEAEALPKVDPVSGEMRCAGDAPPGADRNARYRVDERCLTPVGPATHFNNFYEFTTDKADVVNLVPGFITRPWTLEVRGLVRNPETFDIDDLIRLMPIEERVYRHRCVETWAMTVPWRGFQLSKLLERVSPTSDARFVKFITAQVPSQMPGVQKRPNQPWPYSEGLTIEEAMNELSFMVTGLYGADLPAQNGAPVRLAVPWQYGFKSAKSIVALELTAEQPATFWNTLWAEAYPFHSNVDPAVPHPNWSQAKETLLGTGVVVPTAKYNGYGEFVAQLYG